MTIISRNTTFLCRVKELLLLLSWCTKMKDTRTIDGIFVLNGQIFSVDKLITIMRRHGIRISPSEDGLIIEGERISSLSNIGPNSCPLAQTCEKRIAITEFLKLQRKQHPSKRTTQSSDEYGSPLTHDDYSSHQQSITPTKKPGDSHRGSFIKPNNHDLFEGNIEDGPGLFDEPIEESEDFSSLFDEPESFREANRRTDIKSSQYPEKDYSEQFFSREQTNGHSTVKRRTDEPFCPSCGTDIDPSWNSCPHCGKPLKKGQNSRRDKLFI